MRVSISLGFVAAMAWGAITGECSCVRNNPQDIPLRRYMRDVVQGSGAERSGSVFTQKVDHFAASDRRTFEQRYTLDTTHLKPGGPLFFFLSGEAPMEFFAFQEVQILKWAETFGAAYAVLEHRYYGKSFPFATTRTEDMAFLSSRQALEDAAAFVPFIRGVAGISTAAPAVVFGCSYSGALSSWFRLVHPELVVASVAPSGPVLAQYDFSGFFELFPASAGEACAGAVAKGTAELESYITQGRTRELCTLFDCCEGDIAAQDLDYFRFQVTGSVGSADQMSNPPTWSLNGTCAALEDQSAGPLAALVRGFNYANSHPDGVQASSPLARSRRQRAVPIRPRASQCNSFNYTAMVDSLRSTSAADNADGGRSWQWQKCTEFGFFKGTTPGNGIFPYVPVSLPANICQDVFGIPGMRPDVDGTNAFYGGKSLNATNVVFTNGLKDPWHLLSITEPEGNVGALTYEAGHCAPLIAASSIDPPSLTDTREKVTSFLAGVLSN